MTATSSLKHAATKRLDEAHRNHLEAIETIIHTVMGEGHGQGILGEMGQYHFTTGGKRLRALIPTVMMDMLTPDRDAGPFLSFPAAVEILHNATLVHDDLQDGDETRRGQATIWKQYGDVQAINCGDALFFWGLALLDQLPVSASIHRSLVRMYTDSSLQVIQGQANEFALKDRIHNASLDAYLDVVRGKTGGLLALPIRGAGLIATQSDSRDEVLRTIGDTLGVVFQIQDDLLDIIGEKGRSIHAADLAEGKPSYLAVHALNHATPEDRAAMVRILETPRERTSESDIEEGISILERAGSIDAGIASIQEHHRLLLDQIEALDHPELQEFLGGLTEIFLNPIQGAISGRQK